MKTKTKAKQRRKQDKDKDKSKTKTKQRRAYDERAGITMSNWVIILKSKKVSHTHSSSTIIRLLSYDACLHVIACACSFKREEQVPWV